MDAPVLPDLLAQIPEDEPVASVTADGAYNPGLRPFRAELIHWINSETPFAPRLPRRRCKPRRGRDYTTPAKRQTLEEG